MTGHMFEDDRNPGSFAAEGSEPTAAQAGVRASRVRFEAAEAAVGAADGPADGSRRASAAGTSRTASDADLALLVQYREEYVEASRRKAQAEAEQATALAKLTELSHRIARESAAGARGNEDMVLRSFAAECAARVKVSDRAILGQCSDAWKLAVNFPNVLEALHEGTITTGHARAITASGETLPDEERGRYEARALELAAELTPGRLRTRLRQVADALQPVTLEERHAVAAECRKVWVRDLDDGMAELGAELPAVLAYGIYDRLSRGARATRRAAAGVTVGADGAEWPGGPGQGDGSGGDSGPGASGSAGGWVDPLDARGLDQLRADILADLLLTGAPTADATDKAGIGAGAGFGRVSQAPTHRAGVTGIVPSVTLLLPTGEGAEAATLLGYGPIDAVTARQLSSAAPGWNRVGLDENDGVVTTDRYRITESMRRTLEARDQHCRFPGCRMPTRYCDVDHTVEWMNGGETSLSNTAHLCRRHHGIKHPDLHDMVRWSVRQEPGGVLIWTGPSGVEYGDQPEFRYAGPRDSSRGTTPPESPPAEERPSGSAPTGASSESSQSGAPSPGEPPPRDPASGEPPPDLPPESSAANSQSWAAF